MTDLIKSAREKGRRQPWLAETPLGYEISFATGANSL